MKAVKNLEVEHAYAKTDWDAKHKKKMIKICRIESKRKFLLEIKMAALDAARKRKQAFEEV